MRHADAELHVRGLKLDLPTLCLHEYAGEGLNGAAGRHAAHGDAETDLGDVDGRGGDFRPRRLVASESIVVWPIRASLRGMDSETRSAKTS